MRYFHPSRQCVSRSFVMPALRSSPTSSGYIHRISVASKSLNKRADKIFDNYQAQASDGTLEFRRWPMRAVSQISFARLHCSRTTVAQMYVPSAFILLATSNFDFKSRSWCIAHQLLLSQLYVIRYASQCFFLSWCLGGEPYHVRLHSCYASSCPYPDSSQYVGGADNTVPWEGAPSAVVDARALIQAHLKQALNIDYEFNEVLRSVSALRHVLHFTLNPL